MGAWCSCLLLYFSFSLCLSPLLGSLLSELVKPDFTGSNLDFVDQSGAFLSSAESTFQLGIFHSGSMSAFYLSVVYAASNSVIWTANRNTPITNTGKVTLSSEGLRVSDQNGQVVWSTPPFSRDVSTLRLTRTGNLVLQDQSNQTLWESFDYPTDTIVIGQRLPVGAILSSAVSTSNLATGDYSLQVTSSDAILQWRNQTYWKISMDPKAFSNSIIKVRYMTMNSTGVYLLSENGREVVMKIGLSASKFAFAKIDSSGQFVVRSYSDNQDNPEFEGPQDECKVPFFCNQLGICRESSSGTPSCSCPSGFIKDLKNDNKCLPAGGYSLTISCNSTSNGSQVNPSAISYLSLGNSVAYFASEFSQPEMYGSNFSSCKNFCSASCSCLGFFYNNATGSCYFIKNFLSSIISKPSGGLYGFVKVVNKTSPNLDQVHKRKSFPIIAVVLLPFTGLSIGFVAALYFWRRMRRSARLKAQLDDEFSSCSEDADSFYIPGLPQRYDYTDLVKATDNFKCKIGSGGFGSVYKGTLMDKTVVAVKKLTNVGVQGNKEFCTEIAVIGKTHHMNLVKLRGFCAQGRHRLLVYEYMNRGSLEKTLFAAGPVLEWQERMDIALGTARGLAYLHSECEQKIIHCDVKPENILLHDRFQSKLSDFGLAKLLNSEQSSLFTTMRGTRGYLAPEWLTNSAISDKTDVYSFGMVLLELVSGRKNCSTRSQNQSRFESDSESSSSAGTRLVYFPLLALEMHEQGRYLELADSRLEGRVTEEDVRKLVRIALCCVHEEPILRPNMVSVVGMLEGTVSLGTPRVESLKFLRFYGQRYAEASMVEDNALNSIGPFVDGNNSVTTSQRDSNFFFSYISSQQVSGPR